MKLLKIILISFFLAVFFDLISSRKKKKKKFISGSESEAERNQNKDTCQDRCSQLCSQTNENGVQCTHGMCFPRGLPICYCWYHNSQGKRVNCDNVKLS